MGFLFLFLGYMGVPVAFALIASVLLVTIFTPVSEASMIAQVFNGMDVEALLAVPFFLLVGDLMTSANGTNRMNALARTLVGHLRGRIAPEESLLSIVFARISGSSAAPSALPAPAASTLPRATVCGSEAQASTPPPARERSAATQANLIPTRSMAVVVGATGAVSIVGLFLAGVVRGVLVCFGLLIFSPFFGPV